MAIDIKEILANGLLDLCHKKDLSQITVKDLLEATGVSRQTFYNHFLDKNDLIQYIYNHKIINHFIFSRLRFNKIRIFLIIFNKSILIFR